MYLLSLLLEQEQEWEQKQEGDIEQEQLFFLDEVSTVVHGLVTLFLEVIALAIILLLL